MCCFCEDKQVLYNNTHKSLYIRKSPKTTSSISMNVGEQNPPYDLNITYTLHTHTIKNVVCFHSNIEVLIKYTFFLSL